MSASDKQGSSYSYRLLILTTHRSFGVKLTTQKSDLTRWDFLL